VTPSEFLEKWSSSAAAERSNAQSFVIDLCTVLNVDPPHAATSDALTLTASPIPAAALALLHS